MEMHMLNELTHRREDGTFLVHAMLSTVRFDLSGVDRLYARTAFLYSRETSPWREATFKLVDADVLGLEYLGLKPPYRRTAADGGIIRGHGSSASSSSSSSVLLVPRPVVFFSLPLLPVQGGDKIAVECLLMLRFVDSDAAEFFDLEIMYEDIVRDYPEEPVQVKEDDGGGDFFDIGVCVSAVAAAAAPATAASASGGGGGAAVNFLDHIVTQRQQQALLPDGGAGRGGIPGLAAAGADAATPGPLEPPSVIRGVTDAADDGRVGGRGCFLPPPGTVPGGPEYGSRHPPWKAVDVFPIVQLHTADLLYRVIYDRSAYLRPKITQPSYSNLCSCFFLRHETYAVLRRAGEALINRFFEAVDAAEGTVFQKFLCHVPVDCAGICVPDLVYLAQSTWTANVDTRSCIIKGLVANTFKARKRYCFVKPLDRNCYWADVIDVKGDRVYYGRIVRLDTDEETGLLTSSLTTGGRLLGKYEQQEALSVLYINADLLCIWSFAGGFAVEFSLRASDAGDVGVLGTLFGAPSQVFKPRVRFQKGYLRNKVS
ncbi:packaging subunit 1 [Proboscivirus elephantidbeta4]|uniref:Packaging subunit 1 n=1 Tax=Elephant endotheliotropic herpesvirus 4 TaxID=548914 RepID=A0A0S1TPB4_9BETA|nr:packaging subunit 1 [Elephant endotheliotropic herpesvirus 4]ALM26013.1 packaging subunit 1 [Elephant endotheliotropic herpesvirus 4]